MTTFLTALLGDVVTVVALCVFSLAITHPDFWPWRQ